MHKMIAPNPPHPIKLMVMNISSSFVLHANRAMNAINIITALKPATMFERVSLVITLVFK